MKDELEENLGKEYIDDNENVISTKSKEYKEEENKNSEKIEIKKEPIIEEIDTTVPKNNPEENNNLEQNDGNTILKEINQNTICHKLILKGSDIDITEKVYFKCYKLKAKSNVISFITGSKKVKIPYIIILDEIDGLLVENGNVEKLAEALILMIQHPEQRIAMAGKAIENVQRFRIDQIAGRWKTLFESL